MVDLLIFYNNARNLVSAPCRVNLQKGSIESVLQKLIQINPVSPGFSANAN